MTEETPKLRLLDDMKLVDIKDDSLNRRLYVDIIKEVILEKDSKINTIGILGDWGQGKTSVMHFVQKAIEAQGIPNVWFDSWKYENEESLFIPLLSKIYKDLSETKDPILTKAYQTILKDAVVITKALLGTLLGIATLGNMDLEKLEKFEKQFTDDEKLITKIEQYTSSIESMVDDFEEFVSQICKINGRDKLVIFIDDLDRCLPEKVIDFLEKLKVFFFSKQCIYVLAIDPKVITQAIKQKYPSISDEDCFEYVNKIINLPLKLPETQEQFYEKFIENAEISLGVSFGLDKNIIKQCILKSRLHNARKLKKSLNNYLLLKWLRDRGVLQDWRKNEFSNNQICILCFWNEFFKREFHYFLKKIENYNYVGSLVGALGPTANLVDHPDRMAAIKLIRRGEVPNTNSLPHDSFYADMLENAPFMYLLSYLKISTYEQLKRLFEFLIVLRSKE